MDILGKIAPLFVAALMTLSSDAALGYSSSSTSPEVACKDLRRYSRADSLHYVSGVWGNYFTHSLKPHLDDGKVLVTLDGELSIRRTRVSNTSSYARRRVVDPNIFENYFVQNDEYFAVSGINAIDIDNDGLDDIVVQVAHCPTGDSQTDSSLTTSLTFYFNVGGGRFEKGASRVIGLD